MINLSPARKNELASIANFLVMVAAIFGNFLAAAMARVMGYRRSIAMLVSGLLPGHDRDLQRASQPTTTLLVLLPVMGACSGLFALFTMYLPPLFPVLLRTTGAGFCYNIGRIAAAAGTVDLRAVLEGGRLPDRPPLRRLPLLAGDDPRLVAPRSP